MHRIVSPPPLGRRPAVTAATPATRPAVLGEPAAIAAS